jgi:aspartate-semialdehyde dehydrogenase
MRKLKKSGLVVAVIGVGAVGQMIVRVLRERDFPFSEIRIFARRARPVTIDGITYPVGVLSAESFDGVDLAIFAGTEGENGAAEMFADEAVKHGCVVIDNGSGFRKKDEVPLVVPEVNPNALARHSGIIANPNCSTIGFVVGLAPLHRKAGIKRVSVATYQSVSGAGQSAIDEYERQIGEWFHDAEITHSVFPQPIFNNALPHIGSFDINGDTSEERKMSDETHKILDPDIHISATCTRVPVKKGHLLVANVEFFNPLSPDHARAILRNAPGVYVVDEPSRGIYPMPLAVADTDRVDVGRIREDTSLPTGCGLNITIVLDNIRKGAATNAVQIAELLREQ